jgi:D-galactarolactone cycloisomerase
VSAITLASLRAQIYRCPIETPVVTSFGTMHDRPMLLVRAEGRDGTVGWGEAWCNFPSFGAGHRARIVNRILAPLAEGRAFADPPAAFTALTDATAVMALQSGEPGPFAQGIAGVDIALWDLAARRDGQPLWRLLGGTSPDVPVYASGLSPGDPQRLAASCQDEGFRAFKLKLGFGAERDRANLAALRRTLGDGAALMADVNQGWTLDEAQHAASWLAPFGLDWLEEPIRADRPWSEWQALAPAGIPLAAGENLAGEAFAPAIASGALAVLQPDAGKWGGISGTMPLAQGIVAAGLRYCPHWLGGGVGLLASAHLLAAAGGPGLLEVDANPNPLRSLTCGPLARIQDGRATLSDEPGLGPAPDETALRRYQAAA